MESLTDITAIADKFIDMGKINEAINYLSDKINLHPNSPELLDLRAIAYFNILNTEEAIKGLQKAIEIDPNFHLAYAHLAELYSHKLDFENANQHAQKASELVVDNLYYKCLLAFTYLKLKNYDRVLVLCNKILSVKSNYIDAIHYRADAYAHKNEYLKAAVDLEAIYLDNVERYWLLPNIGYYYSKTENLSKAKHYLEKAIQTQPDKPYPYNNLGYVYMVEKNYKKAHKLIDKSIDIDPVNSYAFKNRALVYIAEGKVLSAITALERAKELKFASHYGDEVDVLLNKFKL